MLVLALIVIGGLGIAALGWNLKPAPQPPRIDVALLMRLGLLAGEQPGVLWQARHADGEAMVATITSRAVLALGFSERNSPPVRYAQEGTVVSIGSTTPVIDGAGVSMVSVTIASSTLPDFTVAVAAKGASAIAAWAAKASFKELS